MKTRSKHCFWPAFFVVALLLISACNPEEKDVEDDYDRDYPENITYSKTG